MPGTRRHRLLSRLTSRPVSPDGSAVPGPGPVPVRGAAAVAVLPGGGAASSVSGSPPPTRMAITVATHTRATAQADTIPARCSWKLTWRFPLPRCTPDGPL